MRNNAVQPPTVYVIAGPNGAGKTTFANEFLPDFVHCREFLNADLIAAGLSPFAPETQNVRAGRLLLTRIKELTAAKMSFGFETTLSGRGYVRMLTEMKRTGYRIVLFFLGLADVDVAIARVKNRVRQGVHLTMCPKTLSEDDSNQGYGTYFISTVPLQMLGGSMTARNFHQKW